MLKGLENMIEALKSFDTEEEFREIVVNNGKRLAELMQEQLSYGIDVHGQKRVDEYRPLTKFIKRTRGVGLGAVTDRVTFFMTGELYGDLEAEFSGDQFEIRADDNFKFHKMIERIGDKNYGLDEDQRIAFGNEVVLPQFADVFKTKTGLIISL